MASGDIIQLVAVRVEVKAGPQNEVLEGFANAPNLQLRVV